MKKRYLRNWEYNAALILQELENIVLNHDGILVSTWDRKIKPVEIENRALSAAVREQRERVKHLEALQRPALAAQKQELERLEAIPNDPIISNYGEWLYIGFALDGCYYYYSIDANPFFDFHYGKTAIDGNGMITKNYYLNADKKEWLYDCFFKFDCSNADRKEAANMIFNMLLSAECSGTYFKRDAKKEKLYTLEAK